MDSKSYTVGEWKVGVTFNPSQDKVVFELKSLVAELIDVIRNISVPTTDEELAAEVSRLKALAATEVEAGAMWAVKAATKTTRE